MKTLSLKTSTAIGALGMKIETDKVWRGLSSNTANEPELWVYSWRVVSLETPVEPWFNNNRVRHVLAPNFQELLDILPQIAPKIVWMPADNEGVGEVDVEIIAHHLLTIYLTGGMEAVDEECKTLLVKN